MTNDDDYLRSEHVSAGDSLLLDPAVPGLELKGFASKSWGAIGFSTGMALFQPGAELSAHTHDCSEAITVLEGDATVSVEERIYCLGALDCIHVPSGIVHSLRNGNGAPLSVHSAFSSSEPRRKFSTFQGRENMDEPGPGNPETIRRFSKSDVYELSAGAFFTDLFARRFGAHGICGGYGRFLPGASLPCHTHEFDESITIVTGTAKCLVKGRSYELSGCETAFIPRHRPHRFLNETDSPMAMIWVYAGDEPDRTIVPGEYCTEG